VAGSTSLHVATLVVAGYAAARSTVATGAEDGLEGWTSAIGFSHWSS
jgi:hypothetical protein